jgi:hypothetical protein
MKEKFPLDGEKCEDFLQSGAIYLTGRSKVGL